MAIKDCPDLSNFAKKLLSVPACVLNIKHSFNVQSLTKEKAEKLESLYFNLRLSDSKSKLCCK